MQVEKIVPGLYRAKFLKVRDLAMSFFRMQEYYDDSMFHGKLLTKDEFVSEWSERRGNGVFNYADYWSGYGLNGKTLTDWLNKITKITTLEKKEEKMLKTLAKTHGNSDFSKLYLFGVCNEEGDEEKVIVTKHEIAHFLYYQNRRYRQKVKNVINLFPKEIITRFELQLKKKYYHRKVYKDEIQADIATSGKHGMFGAKKIKVGRKYFYLYDKISTIYSYYIDELFNLNPNPTIQEELGI